MNRRPTAGCRVAFACDAMVLGWTLGRGGRATKRRIQRDL